jgi:hypothetical protein
VCACYCLLCIVCYSRDLRCYILLIFYVPCDVRFDVASNLVQVLVRFSLCAGIDFSCMVCVSCSLPVVLGGCVRQSSGSTKHAETET